MYKNDYIKGLERAIQLVNNIKSDLSGSTFKSVIKEDIMNEINGTCTPSKIALRVIRNADINSDPSTQWMQQWAAWGLDQTPQRPLSTPPVPKHPPVTFENEEAGDIIVKDGNGMIMGKIVDHGKNTTYYAFHTHADVTEMYPDELRCIANKIDTYSYPQSHERRSQ